MKIKYIAAMSVALLMIAGSAIFFNHFRDTKMPTPSPVEYMAATEAVAKPDLSSPSTFRQGNKKVAKNTEEIPDNTPAEVIHALILKIGIRAIPLKDSPSLGDLAKQAKSNRFDPIKELFPYAGKLVDIGPEAIVPVAKHWASLSDLSSDEYIASLRTLTTLVKKREDIHFIFENLARKSDNKSDVHRFEKAASHFAPFITEEVQK